MCRNRNRLLCRSAAAHERTCRLEIDNIERTEAVHKVYSFLIIGEKYVMQNMEWAEIKGRMFDNATDLS